MKRNNLRHAPRRASSHRLLNGIAAALLATWACCLGNTAAQAASYVFDVDYFGSGVASLVAGSDDPAATTLVDGDSFLWTITANGAGRWHVDAGGNFFPLMALSVDPPGIRTGDFTLELFHDGASVFTHAQSGAFAQEVHMGTNTIALSTGLEFDEMRLDYLLDTATDLAGTAPVDTTPDGLLPIFGAPEENSFSPGISYIVPEPAAVALALLAVGGLAVLRRR